MAILVLAGPAGASVQKGDTELEFLGGWLSQSGNASGDFNSWFVSGALNYFISDNVSLGIGGFGSEMDFPVPTTTLPVTPEEGFTLIAEFRDVEQDITAYGVGANIKLHFAPTSRWVPYIGAQIKWVSATVDTTGKLAAQDPTTLEFGPEQAFSTSTDLDGILYGPLAGVRVELNEYNDLFVEGQYFVWGGDIGDLLDNGFGIFVGIVHQFQ